MKLVLHYMNAAISFMSYSCSCIDSGSNINLSLYVNPTSLLILFTFAGNVGSECACDTKFCNVAEVSEKFLFPFAIEFSLVASCLLYITWSNVGIQPEPCEDVVKPSYKFYKSYSGIRTC